MRASQIQKHHGGDVITGIPAVLDLFGGLHLWKPPFEEFGSEALRVSSSYLVVGWQPASSRKNGEAQKNKVESAPVKLP